MRFTLAVVTHSTLVTSLTALVTSLTPPFPRSPYTSAISCSFADSAITRCIASAGTSS